METDLKTAFIHVMMRFRKAGMPLPPGINFRMGELFVLGRVSEQGATMTEIQNNLFMTKSAVSQTLSALESRGLIRREIDARDRRKITVTLTDAGRAFQHKSHEYANIVLDMTLARFGKENMEELVRLLTTLSDITEEVKQEAERQFAFDNLKGDKPVDETR